MPVQGDAAEKETTGGTYEEPIRRFLQISLSLNHRVQQQVGTAPLLSDTTYSYGIPEPDWDWEELGKQIEALKPMLRSLSPDRAAYMYDIVSAYAMMVCEGQGDAIPYAKRVETYLQVPGERVPSGKIAELRNALRAALLEAGYPEDLSVAIPAWSARQTIPRKALLAEADNLMARAKAATLALGIRLPAQHRVALSFPDNYPHYAYSAYFRDYQGAVLLSNDIDWPMPSLRHSICHEAFPGHQTFSAIREDRYRAGLLPIEATVYFSNTPVSPVNEGLAECGTEILGLIETVDDRIFSVYNSLCFAVSTNVAFDCNSGGVDEHTAVACLMDELGVSRAWAEQRYHFLTHPLWRTSFPHYWYGRELMLDMYRQMKDSVPEFLNMVYWEPHTVNTLRRAVEQLHA